MRYASVLIPAYNRNDSLEVLCRRLRQQQDVELEIIILDDGSKPPAILPELCDRYIWRKDVGYHRTQNLNEGISLASHDFLIFLDDDCIPLGQQWAVAHLETLKRNHISRGPFEIMQFSADYTQIISKLPQTFGGPDSYFSSVNLAARRDALVSIGAFDPEYDGYYGYEDYDLGMRVQQAKLKVGYADGNALVAHIGKPFSDDNNPDFKKRNRDLFQRKWNIKVD